MARAAQQPTHNCENHKREQLIDSCIIHWRDILWNLLNVVFQSLMNLNTKIHKFNLETTEINANFVNTCTKNMRACFMLCWPQ